MVGVTVIAMKILHLSSEFPPQTVYGLGRYVSELSEAQSRLGHSVEVLTNSLGGKESDREWNGVRVRRVHAPPPPKAPTTSSMLLHFNLQLVERCVESILHENAGFDVVNTHDWLTFSAGFHLARLLKCPLVSTIHDVIFNKVKGREFGKEDAFVAGIENWACHVAARTIVLSETVRVELLKSYHALGDRVCVVRGGVGIKPLDRGQLDALATLRRKYVEDDEALLAYVGRLDGEKGLQTLLRACDALRSMRPNGWRVVLIGGGVLRDQLEQAVEAMCLHSHVSFAGYLPFDELRIAYGAADVVVVPSEYEPFGLVALEAQRLGTPAIVADTGGLSETIQLTRGGLAFPAGDETRLAACLDRAVASADLTSALGCRGARSVKRHFNWEGVAQRVCVVYEDASHEGVPQNIVPPEWSHPVAEAGKKIPEEREKRPSAPSEPVTDVAVFWDSARMPALRPVLECLVQCHAVKTLGTKLNVIPVCHSNAQAPPWEKPLADDRIRYLDAKQHESELREVLLSSALAIADGSLKAPLLTTRLLLPRRTPTVWCDEVRDVGVDGLHIASADDLRVACTKLLCDEKLRGTVAPDADAHIPQRSWEAPVRDLPRIVHVLPQLVTGGAETTLLDIVKSTQSKFEHEILSIGPLEGPLPAEFEKLGVRVDGIEAIRDTVLDHLEERKPNLIHLHSMSYVPKWMPIHRCLSGAGIVETEHVVNIGSCHFGHVDRLVCVSKATAKAHDPYRWLLDRSCSDVQVIYNGIDPVAYEGLPSKKDARRLLGLPADRPIIGRVSALARNKLPTEALETIPRVLELMPDALFVIVGDGPARGSAEKWIESQGLRDHVRFMGERRDIPTVLRAFDVFAYYTTKDSLGNVILEARAAGVPVVTTDVEGTKEALGSAAGKLTPLGDTNAFAEAVADLLRDPQEQKHEGKRLPKKFRSETMGNSYEDAYRSLLEKHSQQVGAEIHPGPAAVQLLIKMPTRSRPERFLAMLTRYRDHLSGKHQVRFVISCDVDDESMNNEGMKSLLQSMPDVDLHFSENRNKVEAINADLHHYESFRALLVASDDMVPQIRGYDDIILRAMNRYFPSTDGALFFNDGFRGRDLNTLPIMGEAYYRRFGHVYRPDYFSLWCDNEFTEVARLLGRQVYIDQVIIRHEHALNTGQSLDGLYTKNEEFFHRDREVFEARRKSLFDVRPRIVLSILICTLDSRGPMLARLREKLEAQILRAGLQHNIEIRSHADDGSMPIGTKRNSLLREASGEYVCFVDDDDDLAGSYIEDIWGELADGSVDCVGMAGLMIGPNGTQPKLFIHSNKYKDSFERNSVYYRPPNHLNPMRREIAIRYGFPKKNEGEDLDFCSRIARDGVLKTERFIEHPLYIYFPSCFRGEPER